MIKVFGHKSPDTDATCAPIAYSWYLKQIGVESEAYVLGDLNKETRFVLESAGVAAPKKLESLSEGDEVVVIDTNNPDELPDNLNTVKITKIIDHHKLSGLTTDSPLDIFMKPVGSSSTLVFQRIGWEGLTPPKEIATLLLSAIISDTLNFTSPTTTEEDKKAAQDLEKIAEVKISDHAEKMFEAKSDLSGMSAKDILLSDSKVFDLSGKKVRISSLETTKPANAKEQSEQIKKAMEELKKEEKLDGAYFFIIDILGSSAELLASGEIEKELAQKAFAKKFDGEYMNLPGVVSRKKQIVPRLESVYA